MELNREHFRAIIFYNFRCGLTQQQQCIDELNLIFGNEAPSRTSFYRWYGEFNRGRSSLQDEFREGRPKSFVVPETIDSVRWLILQDRHVTYPEIKSTLGISGTSIHSILQDHDDPAIEIDTTLGISGTSIHSILHEYLIEKKKIFALDATQFVKRSKKALCRSVK